MRGLAGVVLLDGRDVTRPLLDRLVAATPYIGHDAIGYWSSGCAGMVHFHHATTPEAVNEKQPFQHPRSGNVICFDGRIDNRSELSALLGGVVSHSSPDCEFVAALYEKYGLDCLERLVGDYAFAIWQPKDRRLFCGRSPVGWRPFLWTFDGKRVKSLPIATPVSLPIMTPPG